MFVFFKRKSNFTDSELLRHFRNTGQDSFFEELFQRYAHLVYGSCISYLKDGDKAKDAVLEIFEKLSTEAAKTPIQHLSSWIFTVTRNHCLMQLRRAGKENLSVSLESISEDAFMENDTLLHLNTTLKKEELLTRMEQCMETLSKEQKLCLQLFYLQQLDYKSVGENSGFDQNKVKSYIQNGKRNLKLCIEAKLPS